MEIYEGNNWKLYKTLKKLLKCVILPPNRCDRGVDLPIPMTINSSSFGLLSVNEAQDLMPLKFKAFLMNKLHPNDCFSKYLSIEAKTKNHITPKNSQAITALLSLLNKLGHQV